MNRNYKTLCMIISALSFVSACSDDGSSTSPQDKESTSCSESRECPDGKVCHNEKCMTEAHEGDDCSDKETTFCANSECINDTCKSPEPADKHECENNDDCSGEFVCRENKCVAPAIPPLPETPTCATNGECATDEYCDKYNGCQKKVALDAACELTEQCQVSQFCGYDNFCTDRLERGDICFNDFECKDGYTCNEHCVIEGKTLGEPCEEFVLCQNDLQCVNNHCQASVQANEACDDNHFCPQNYFCFSHDGKSKCIKEHGTCTTDNDCSADSYCCTDETCSTPNICISYGEGPRENQNLACAYQTVPGLFEAMIQCEWKSPEAGDLYPNHANVLMTPIVMNTPHDSGTAQEIIFTTYNNSDGGAPSGQGSDIRYYGVIRIINAETCALHESIFDDNNHIIGGSNIAAGDVDNDGFVEIFAGRGSAQNTANGAASGGGIVAFHWDDAQKKYVTKWNTSDHSGNTTNWGGPAIHDINDDGIPEIIGYGGEAFNAQTGARLNPGQSIAELYYTPTLGDFDHDGNVEIIGTVNVFRWNKATSQWETAYSKKTGTGIHPAFADFGTRNSDGSFDTTTPDGIAEIVNCGSNVVQISTLQGENILRVEGLVGGGPCTIGDFDGDNMPEVAAAFGDSYRIFDPECKAAGGACTKPYILWEKLSQDSSSSSTGSSLFDFDGDGAMEAVYADECYTRIYDGKTGDVLFSAYRSSATWHEYPVIADVDNDESAEIIVGSNNRMNCASPDPIHRGLRCASDSDCKSGVCKSGFCRCTDDSQCSYRYDAHGNLLNEYGCVAPIPPDSAADGNVCRAIRSNTEIVTGVRVMKDRLDRWMSSRNIWNQHAYSITNINDDQTIPKTSSWAQNFLNKTLNNFRQNMQGNTGANRAPDITGRFVGDTCARSGEQISLGAEICNRGTKMVSKLMPASFYKIDKDEQGKETRTLLCTSYTTENVPVGGCLHVTCNISEVINGDVVLVANDDGNGGRTTVECNDDNNEDRTTVNDCPIVIN